MNSYFLSLKIINFQKNYGFLLNYQFFVKLSFLKLMFEKTMQYFQKIINFSKN